MTDNDEHHPVDEALLSAVYEVYMGTLDWAETHSTSGISEVEHLLEGLNAKGLQVANATALGEALELLDSLTDTTWLLLHTLDKGYRTEDQAGLVKIVLQDAVRLLQEHRIASGGCTNCGSRRPEHNFKERHE